LQDSGVNVIWDDLGLHLVANNGLLIFAHPPVEVKFEVGVDGDPAMVNRVELYRAPQGQIARLATGVCNQLNDQNICTFDRNFHEPAALTYSAGAFTAEGASSILPPGQQVNVTIAEDPNKPRPPSNLSGLWCYTRQLARGRARGFRIRRDIDSGTCMVPGQMLRIRQSDGAQHLRGNANVGECPNIWTPFQAVLNGNALNISFTDQCTNEEVQYNLNVMGPGLIDGRVTFSVRGNVHHEEDVRFFKYQ